MGGWVFLSQSEEVGWPDWLQEQGRFCMDLWHSPLRVNEVFYSGNVSVRRGSIMKRLAGTVLGLLLSQVCCELGLTHWGIWRIDQLLYFKGRERSWQVLQTFYPSHHLWALVGAGAVSGFCRSYGDPHLWLFLLPHQVCEKWMVSRVLQSWISRRKSTPRIGVTFPLPHRVWIDIRTLGAHSPGLHCKA